MNLLLLLSTGLLWGGPLQTSWQPIAHPAQAKAMAVNLSRDGDDLIMSWIAPKSRHEGALRVARYRQNRWLPPVTVFQGDQLFINWADIPKVLLGSNFSLAVWPQMTGAGSYDYGLRYRTSSDGGSTWAPPQWLHDDRQPAEHGFVSLIRLEDARIGAVWLDGRAMASTQTNQDGHAGRGGMQLRYREITQAGLLPEELLDDMTCECCGTDMILFQKQPMVVYRDKTKDHIRDISWAKRDDKGQWQKEQSLIADRWQIHGCPVNGPALAQNGEEVIGAWFTMSGQKPQVRLASNRGQLTQWVDRGTFGIAPKGRVHLGFLDKDHYIMVWLESGDAADAIFYAIFRTGAESGPVLPATRLDETGKDRASGFPKLMVVKNTCFLAYQNPEAPGIKIQKLDWKK